MEAFLRTSSSLAKNGLLTAQNQHVRSFDEFSFFVERLEVFGNCVFPVEVLVFKSQFSESCCFQGRDRIILEGSGFAAFYPAFLFEGV